MAIGDDIGINTTHKIISHDSGSTVYTVNDLYTELMDTFDDLAYMDDDVPMSAQTPYKYTMINGWYIEEELTQYLNEGAIITNGYNGEVRTLYCSSTGYVNCVAGDVTKTVTGGTTSDTGVLLDYDNDAYKWWVRMSDTADLFDHSTETYTIGSGTGSAVASQISATGEHWFSNLYTIGTLENSPTLYIYQNGSKIDGWWSSGQIDVLIKTVESGVTNDSKAVTVFARQWQDQYDSYGITLSDNGHEAVPLVSITDANNESVTTDIYNIVDTDMNGGTSTGINITFSFATAYSADINEDGSNEEYYCKIDCNSVAIESVYEALKWITREGSTSTLKYSSDSDTINGEAYRYLSSDFNEVKACPFGSFAGGKLFAAKGVYLVNLHPDDIQNYQLIALDDEIVIPPNKQNLTITNISSNDTVAVFLDDGSNEVDKDTYSADTNTLSAGTLTLQDTIPADTPSSGFVIAVQSDGAEQVYEYSAWASSAFTLTNGTLSTAYNSNYDLAYVPYIYTDDVSGSSTYVQLEYTTDRAVVVRVRRSSTSTKILPFETFGTFGSTGLTVAAIRTEDSVIS